MPAAGPGRSPRLPPVFVFGTRRTRPVERPIRVCAPAYEVVARAGRRDLDSDGVKADSDASSAATAGPRPPRRRAHTGSLRGQRRPACDGRLRLVTRSSCHAGHACVLIRMYGSSTAAAAGRPLPDRTGAALRPVPGAAGSATRRRRSVLSRPKSRCPPAGWGVESAAS